VKWPALLAALALALGLASAPARLADSADVSARGFPWEYTFLVKSTVARWDPCTPIGWRVNTRLARPGALRDARTAFWRLGRRTGFTFVYRGRTSVVPQWGPLENFPAGTQIVVAWIRKGQSSIFATIPDASAATVPSYLTGYHASDGSPAYRIARAGVVIDSTLRIRGGYDLGITRGDLLLHELGHAMGLDHYPSTAEMMNPVTTRSRARYGRGDIAGLAERGARLGCLYAD
jgi:hypothetical protein